MDQNNGKGLYDHLQESIEYGSTKVISDFDKLGETLEDTEQDD